MAKVELLEKGTLINKRSLESFAFALGKIYLLKTETLDNAILAF